MTKQLQTGKGTIPITHMIAVWSISALNSLPGLAVSPILGKLSQIFPAASEVEIQMLSSLPSLMIIPFILFAGKLSLKIDPIRLLLLGLGIFALSGILYLIATTIHQLILISALLGVGSGLIVPLSTGLISDFFVGRYRTYQMGLCSAINNGTLVLATFLTGWLAQYTWRTPFAIYLLPLISIYLVYRYLPRHLRGKEVTSTTEPTPTANPNQNSFGKFGIHINPLLQLMLFYGGITYLALCIPLNLPFLMEEYGLGSQHAGTIISLFFLAIMAPGFFLNKIICHLGKNTKQIALIMMTAGIALIILIRSEWIAAFGALLCGFGYGILQPLFYDETTRTATPARTTLALAFLMSMNYVATLIAPLIDQTAKNIAHVHNEQFTFFFVASISLLLTIIAFLRPQQFAFRLNSDTVCKKDKPTKEQCVS